ncbi:ATPase family AAA domain-containing protein 2-like [Cyclopterus lumpus]|uniref:ATPase family AAA domain-containing protein 2-like n=1 Tax=Cyclopterus lumpus TaxID=8103 RepID=UPI0014869C32|nr:ATPase family AAA domain-containing protein 2-like [Cyclopterus lumpus]
MDRNKRPDMTSKSSQLAPTRNLRWVIKLPEEDVGFDSICGLSDHITALKEMVVFPLLYPELNILPPSRKTSFFMRNGRSQLPVSRLRLSVSPAMSV